MNTATAALATLSPVPAAYAVVSTSTISDRAEAHVFGYSDDIAVAYDAFLAIKGSAVPCEQISAVAVDGYRRTLFPMPAARLSSI